MVGDALAGQARHAPQQVRDKRDAGFTGKPEPRPIDAKAKEILAEAKATPDPTDRSGKGEGFNQHAIDLVRTRVMNFAMAQEVARLEKKYVQEGVTEYPALEGVFHLWFPEPNSANYELRTGNPPADDPRDRPKHLLGKRLALDYSKVTEAQWAAAAARLATVMRSRFGKTVHWVDAIASKGIITDVGAMVRG